MTWTPCLSDADCHGGHDGMLNRGLRRFGAKPTMPLRDENGVFAILTTYGVFTAKKYIYGNIVSAHKRAVIAAYNFHQSLIMYIEDEGKYYAFRPEEIMKNSQENERGGAKMLNWDIKIGVRLNE